MEIAVEAIRFNTLSKLTLADSVLFDNIVKDVFTGVTFVDFEFHQLTNALKASAVELGLQINEHQVSKQLLTNTLSISTRRKHSKLIILDEKMFRTIRANAATNGSGFSRTVGSWKVYDYSVDEMRTRENREKCQVLRDESQVNAANSTPRSY